MTVRAPTSRTGWIASALVPCPTLTSAPASKLRAHRTWRISPCGKVKLFIQGLYKSKNHPTAIPIFAVLPRSCRPKPRSRPHDRRQISKDGVAPYYRRTPTGRGAQNPGRVELHGYRSGRGVEHRCQRLGQAAVCILTLDCRPNVGVTRANRENVIFTLIDRSTGWTGGQARRWKCLGRGLHQWRFYLIGSKPRLLFEQQSRRTASIHRRGEDRRPLQNRSFLIWFTVQQPRIICGYWMRRWTLECWPSSSSWSEQQYGHRQDADQFRKIGG